MKHKLRTALVFLLLMTPAAASAQSGMTKVRGRVLDASTGEAIAYAAVFFDGTSIGVSTGDDGRFYIETRDSSALVLTASMLGYLPASSNVPSGSYSELDFALSLDPDMLDAARIRPDNRYIRQILKKIDENRAVHDYELGAPWSVNIYSKIELDATHAEWLAESRMFGNMLGDVLNYRDTSVVTGEPYIPILLSETFSEKYHSSDPKVDKEIILANRISGVAPDNFMRQYSGSYLLSTNFYKSAIRLFNLDVPSPASAYGQLFYNYFLVDSLQMDGRKSYCLRFHPKRGVSSPTFDGELYIDAEDFGIRSVHVALSKVSNVNWIRHINIDSENLRTADGRWFPKQEKLFIDFSIAVSDSSKVLSFLGNRELHYSNLGNKTVPPDALESPGAVVSLGAAEIGAEWESSRPVPLSQREQGIYRMVDELQQKSSYKAWYTIIRSLITGYIEGEGTRIAYGPWAQSLTYNSTEGWHVGAGFRTSRFFHPSIRLKANVGYGFRDHLIKGGASFEYMIRRDKTRKLTLAGTYDYRQLGHGSGALSQPSIFTSLSSGGHGDKQTLIRDFRLDYEHEFSSVFTAFLSAEAMRLYGNAAVPLYRRDSTMLRSISANQLRLSARFAWEERIDRGHFHKSRLFTRYPVVSVDLSGAVRGITGDDYSFFRGELTFDWKIPAGAFGFGFVHLNGGAILGEIPYPFLKLHEGNQSWFLDRTSFSCMNYYEFASDSWVSAMYEHNLNGLILGRIPLVRRLDLREIISVRAAYGTISDKNLYETEILPIAGLSSLQTPYVEVGAGLSNILRVLRFDAVWRLTHRRPVSADNFRVTAGFDVQF